MKYKNETRLPLLVTFKKYWEPNAHQQLSGRHREVIEIISTIVSPNSEIEIGEFISVMIID